MKILELIGRPRVVVVLGLAILTSGVLAWQWATQVPDPVFNGRRLSEHLASIQIEGFKPVGSGIQRNVRHPFVPAFMGAEELRREVAEALESAGTQSHPLLVRMLHARASRWSIFLYPRLRSASDRYPQLKRFVNEVPPGDLAWHQQARAALALRHLGPRAQAVLPEVLPLLDDPDRALVAAMAVLYLRPERESDILQLTNQLRITQLPAFARGPTSIDWNNASTLLVLATFGEKARGAAPVLIPYLSSTSEMVRGSAALALAAGRSEPQVVVPMLTKSLSNLLQVPLGLGAGRQARRFHDSTPAEMMIQALGRYGADAASAIPILEAYARTDDFERFIAAEVLNKVRGAVEAAPPTGK